MFGNKSATATRPTSTHGSPSTVTWLGFIAMCVGMFMAILDVQIVATSLPTIQGALAISPESMSWIQTSYLIAEAISIPLTGLYTRALSLRGFFFARSDNLRRHFRGLRDEHGFFRPDRVAHGTRMRRGGH